jgi:dihydroorotate dehydrogenase
LIDLYPLAGPLLRAIDPETAHRITVNALRFGLVPGVAGKDAPELAVSALGLEFTNPVGLAAGFDKNAEVPDAMLKQGFGFVEIGSVTPQPQAGNPRPRLFRLPEDQAVINRNGFNNEGLDVIERRMKARRVKSLGIVGANIGANKDSADRTEDYVTGLKHLAPLSDYVTINISSPNTPGLRDLQGLEELDDLLGRVKAAGEGVTIVLKVAPDLDAEGRRIIADLAVQHAIDGMIISNTTIARPNLKGHHKDQAGGLSGVPLFEASTAVLADMYKLTGGKITLIGAGGISSGADAYAKIRAGATLVQLYTALVYQGPALVGRIKSDLVDLLKRDGFASVSEAVGTSHQAPGMSEVPIDNSQQKTLT